MIYELNNLDKLTLERIGPLIEIVVKDPKFNLIGQPQPKDTVNMHRSSALIDTGSTVTILQKSIIEKLDLQPTGAKKIITGIDGNSIEREIFLASFTFPWQRTRIAEVVGCDLKLYDCLIGRDILKYWTLFYNGRTGAFAIDDDSIMNQPIGQEE